MILFFMKGSINGIMGLRSWKNFKTDSLVANIKLYIVEGYFILNLFNND